MARKTKKAKPRYGLASQIADAQKQLKRWPQWMKNLARFEGSNAAKGPWYPDLRD